MSRKSDEIETRINEKPIRNSYFFLVIALWGMMIYEVIQTEGTRLSDSPYFIIFIVSQIIFWISNLFFKMQQGDPKAKTYLKWYVGTFLLILVGGIVVSLI